MKSVGERKVWKPQEMCKLGLYVTSKIQAKLR